MRWKFFGMKLRQTGWRRFKKNVPAQLICTGTLTQIQTQKNCRIILH